MYFMAFMAIIIIIIKYIEGKTKINVFISTYNKNTNG